MAFCNVLESLRQPPPRHTELLTASKLTRTGRMAWHCMFYAKFSHVDSLGGLARMPSWATRLSRTHVAPLSYASFLSHETWVMPFKFTHDLRTNILDRDRHTWHRASGLWLLVHLDGCVQRMAACTLTACDILCGYASQPPVWPRSAHVARTSFEQPLYVSCKIQPL